MSDVNVTVGRGTCAVRMGRYWVGVVSGPRYCKPRRRTPEHALQDAKKLDAIIRAASNRATRKAPIDEPARRAIIRDMIASDQATTGADRLP